MTRGAKIVIFSVVGLFVLAGVYYGFVNPDSGWSPNTTTTTDPLATDATGMSAGDASLTLTPTSGSGSADTTSASTGAATSTGMGMDSTAFAPPATPPATPPTTTPTTTLAVGPVPTIIDSAPLPIGPAPIVTPAPAPVATTASKSDSAPKAESMTTYTVKSGDTLSAIAGEWFRDVNAWPAIVKANPGLNAANLKVGQKINLPAKDSAVRTASSGSRTNAPAASSKGSSHHIVAKGETLASIADKAYGNRSSWKRIYDANKSVIGSNPSALKVGMKLTIPSKG